MARTDYEAVQAVIEVDTTLIPTATEMEPFITVANQLVTEFCTGTAGPATAYTTARLAEIERWLAAHFYAIRDPRVASEAAGPVSASYQSQVGLGLDLTHYGQQAKLLDTNGGLAAHDAATKRGTSRRPVLFWLGNVR